MPYVSYVEFSVRDVPGAAAFYQKVFNWKPAPFGDDYLVASHGDEPGIDTGFMAAQDDSQRVVPTITVPNLDEYADRVAQTGGTIVVEKFTIPTIGYALYFLDPSGLMVGLHEYDPNAA